LFLIELLGSFASNTSDFVMNRSLLNTICATAFKLAVTVLSEILINPRSGPCSLEWGYGGPLVTLSGLLMVFYLNKNFKEAFISTPKGRFGSTG
jgi:hypothetical protein